MGEGEFGSDFRDPTRLALPDFGVLGLRGVAGVEGLLLVASYNPDLLKIIIRVRDFNLNLS